MIILDRPQRVRGGSIQVRLYHRGHLSLYPGTKVHLAVFPSSSGVQHSLPELVGTAIDQTSWPYLLRLSVSLKDRPGVVHEVLASIARHGGNVLYMDTASIEHERSHELEAVVDFRSLWHQLREERARDSSLAAEAPSLQSLAHLAQDTLLADCTNIIQWLDGQPRISARPIRSLQRVQNAVGRQADPSVLAAFATVQKSGVIHLPPIIVAQLEREFQTAHADRRFDQNSLYIVNSDTKERIFRAHFLVGKNEFVWAAFRHNDVPSAISRITGSIREDGTTILSSLNRVHHHRGVNWFEVLLSNQRWPALPAGVIGPSATAMEALRKAIDGPGFRDLNPAVYFDHQQVDEEMRREESTEVELRPQVEPDRLDEWITERERHLKALDTQLQTAEPDARPGLMRERAGLSRGIDGVRSAVDRVARHLFLSIAFTDASKPFIEAVRKAARGRGYVFDLVETEEEQPMIRQEVIRRIQRCTHFLGIWTPSHHESIGGQHRPSPWCVWELGVADAFGKNARVLIENGVTDKDHQAVHSAHFCYRFKPNDKAAFAKELDRAFQSFDRDTLPH